MNDLNKALTSVIYEIAADEINNTVDNLGISSDLTLSTTDGKLNLHTQVFHSVTGDTLLETHSSIDLSSLAKALKPYLYL